MHSLHHLAGITSQAGCARRVLSCLSAQADTLAPPCSFVSYNPAAQITGMPFTMKQELLWQRLMRNMLESVFLF